MKTDSKLLEIYIKLLLALPKACAPLKRLASQTDFKSVILNTSAAIKVRTKLIKAFQAQQNPAEEQLRLQNLLLQVKLTVNVHF